jgi:hypothetical protein
MKQRYNKQMTLSDELIQVKKASDKKPEARSKNLKN